MSAETTSQCDSVDCDPSIIQQQAIKAALISNLGEKCKDCSFAKGVAYRLSVFAVENGLPATDATAKYCPQLGPEVCDGPKEVEGRSDNGCMPATVCPRIGSVAVESLLSL